MIIKLYNDWWLKKYLTALIKKQWGMNLSKFDGIPLPGGGTLRGEKLMAEAQLEIEKMEADLLTSFEGPPTFQIG